MIKAIIFDCFGVLTIDVWRAFCETLPDTVDLKAVRDLNHAFDSGFISKAEFFESVTELTGKRPPDIDEGSYSLGKNDQLISFISSLKPRYKTAIMSNISNDWITRELLTTEEQLLFDEMIFSYQVNMIKPDERMYELACNKLGVEPQEAIMIDDVPGNVTAAQQLGMKGIVYESFEQYKTELEALLDPKS